MSHLQHGLVILIGPPRSAHHDDALWSDLVVVFRPVGDRARRCQRIPPSRSGRGAAASDPSVSGGQRRARIRRWEFDPAMGRGEAWEGIHQSPTQWERELSNSTRTPRVNREIRGGGGCLAAAAEKKSKRS